MLEKKEIRNTAMKRREVTRKDDIKKARKEKAVVKRHIVQN